MKNKSILIYLAIMALTISCNHIYKEYDKESFPTYTWKHGQEITFNPTIEDVNKTYTLTLGVRHLFGFQLSAMNVTVKSTSPSGKVSTKEYALTIKDSEGKYLAKCGGDLCDLEIVVEDNLKFSEPGKYKYVVTHNVKTDRIPGVMEFGLIIDEKEKD